MNETKEIERLTESIATFVRFNNMIMAENDELREEIEQLRKELEETKAQLQYYIVLSVKEVS